LRNLRLIARLDIKGPHLIKSIQLEGVRKVGDPHDFAVRYYHDGADEILYMDAVASLYDRDMLARIVERTAEDVFVPITVGGGIRSLEDAQAMLRAGADKVAVNSAATQNPALISEIAVKFGAQCMVLQIDAKRKPGGGWEALRDCGREHTGLDAVAWAVKGQRLGAGEILLTSVDCEGTRKGFDIELAAAISKSVDIPVIVSGGMGKIEHLFEVAEKGLADAVAMAHVLHYNQLSLPQIRKAALEHKLWVRQI
jgi:cyclase